jgi:hypothetical protein
VLRILSGGSAKGSSAAAGIRLQVNWYYRPEEAEGGRKVRAVPPDYNSAAGPSYSCTAINMYIGLWLRINCNAESQLWCNGLYTDRQVPQ